MSDNAEKIAQLKEEIADLERQDAIFKALAEDQQLAITLHTLLCRWDHTSGCGWFYEDSKTGPDWNGDAHAKYLGKARMIINKCKCSGISTDVAINILTIAKTL